MAYGARRIVDAARAWPLVLHDRTYWPRPLSVRTVLRVEAAMHQPGAVDRAAAIAQALTEAFPPPTGWQRLRWSPPARLLRRLDEASLGLVLRAVLYGPTRAPAVTADEPDDAYAQLKRRHQQMQTPGQQRAISLAVIVATLREAYGEAWYYDAARYDTADGYVDVRSAMADFEGYLTVLAGRKLDHATTFRLARADDANWRTVTAQLAQQAFPEERRSA